MYLEIITHHEHNIQISLTQIPGFLTAFTYSNRAYPYHCTRILESVIEQYNKVGKIHFY